MPLCRSCRAGQTLPQKPQSWLLFSTLVQTPLQFSSPVGQVTDWQNPNSQNELPGQTLPHVPQSWLLNWVSTQAPSHSALGASQLQMPLSQVWPVPQACLQAPQLFTSLPRKTQAPLQAV